MSRTATAVAPSNIALVKYWGKRDGALNLPAAGSLSMTLAGLTSRTTVTFGDPGPDTLVLGGRDVPGAALGRMRRVLDAVRREAGLTGGAHVESANDFPTGAGLASSASGMAALAVAATAAAGWDADVPTLSRLARLGSGSACRSVIGGFAEWLPGERPDGHDSYAVQVATPEHWPLELLVVVVEEGPKPVSSASGMESTAATSPFYGAWIASVGPDLAAARSALLARDFDALARVAQASAVRMHASMMTADPMLLYWRPATLAVMEGVAALRAAGTPAFFTIDAGPNVKVVVPPGLGGPAAATLAGLPGVRRVLRSGPGPGAHLVSAP